MNRNEGLDYAELNSVLDAGIAEAESKKGKCNLGIKALLFRDYKNSYVNKVSAFDFDMLLNDIMKIMELFINDNESDWDDTPRRIAIKLSKYLSLVSSNSEEAEFWDQVEGALAISNCAFNAGYYLLKQAKEQSPIVHAPITAYREKAKFFFQHAAALGDAKAMTYFENN